jgi:hypothetical protein
MVLPQDIVGEVTAIDFQPFCSIMRRILVRMMSKGTCAGSSLEKVMIRLRISVSSSGSSCSSASQPGGVSPAGIGARDATGPGLLGAVDGGLDAFHAACAFR